MASFSQELKPPQNPGRFTLVKWKFLKAICPSGPIRLPRNAVQKLINELAPTLGHWPSLRTFYRWHKVWVFAGRDVRALIDRVELRGRKPKMDFPQQLELIIVESIEKVYLTDQRETKTALLDHIHYQIKLANRTLPPEEAFPKVTMRTINKYIGQYDRYHVLKARYGERYAREAIKIFGAGPDPERPLERVEADHTLLDILVIDERTHLVLGRPWITMMIDCFSRLIIGFHIDFRRPNADSVLRCLRHAIRPKTYVKEKFPEVEGEWPCYGLIETLICDNALEFHGKNLEAAANDVGITIIYPPSFRGSAKGKIERSNRTLSEGLMHGLPGTTFSKYDHRLEYDSNARAVLTRTELEELVHRWVIDVYGCAFHRGIQTAPLEKWAEGVAKFQPKLPPDLSSLKVHLGRIEERQLGKNGIQTENLHYNSEALQDLRRRRGDHGVTVRVDPDNLGTIYVLDDDRKAYILAQCTIPNYAEGLTKEQHRLIRKKARLDYAQLPYADRLLAAKAAMREKVAEILTRTEMLKKHGTPKSAKLSREEREVLRNNDAHEMPPVIDDAAPVHVPVEPDDDAWFDDIPDFSVERRPFEHPEARG